MFAAMVRRITRRDVLFLSVGAFSALALLTFSGGVRPGNIPTLDLHLSGSSPPKKDWGLYEDWSGGELNDASPTDEEKKDVHHEVLPPAPADIKERPPASEPLSSVTAEPSLIPSPARQAIGNAVGKTGWPSTTVLNHAAGWTMFDNLYMSNGTLFVVSAPDDTPSPLGFEHGFVKEGWQNGFPLRRMMTSTGLPGYANEESIREREPTDRDMAFISKEEAERRWGNQVWEVSGNTWLFNDPNQFFSHFYHFVAESLFGIWTFYAGTLDPSITVMGETTAPPPSRAIFLRCTSSDIRDSSKFNTFYLKAAFPSLTVETAPDWNDRVFMTRFGNKAWRFSNAVLTDRSASFRTELVGAQTQRIAAAAYQAVEGHLSRWWWEPVRRAVLRAANISQEIINMAITSPASFDSGLASANGMTHKDSPIVITYISRQGGRARCLNEEDHARLVAELDALAARRGWEFHDIKAQELTQEEQLTIAARTTIMVGVHGNGLSHLLSMAPTRLSTVVELFHPNGFMHDYGWTARALGHHHFAIWNDTMYQHPNLPRVDVPESFQSKNIPVYAPLVVQVIEERLDSVQGHANAMV